MLAVDEAAPPRTFGPISRTDIVRFAGAIGDFQPVHHDEPAAVAAGYPTVFAMGMLQGALLATYATDWLGAAAVRRFRVRFTAQVWPGDYLTCTGVVTAVTPVSTGTMVTLDLACRRQTGDTVVAGDADFLQ